MAPSQKPAKAAAAASRNILNVVLGDTLFETWYPSFYPEELVGRETERLFVCRWCFRYAKEVVGFLTHTVRVLLGFYGKEVEVGVRMLICATIASMCACEGGAAGEGRVCEGAVYGL